MSLFNQSAKKSTIVAGVLITSWLLTACSGSSSSPSDANPAPATYTVTGVVTGLTSNELLTLANNGSEPVTVTASGSFAFPMAQLANTSYAVTITSQPIGQTCTVAQGSGTVTADVSNIAVSCASTSLTVLWSFNGSAASDGAIPQGQLIQAADGFLYGVTEFGGTHCNSADNGSDNGCVNVTNPQRAYEGTLFRYDPIANTETVLYSFGANANDAINPQSPLMQASDGNLYGATPSGGQCGYGAIFEYNLSTSQESIKYSFGVTSGACTNTTDGQSPTGALLQVGSNLYGTAPNGGVNSTGTLFAYNLSTGVESTAHDFGDPSVTNDGQNPTAGVVQDSAGNLYGVTYSGGAYYLGAQAGGGTIFKYTMGAATEAPLYSFGNNLDGQIPLAGLVIDSSDNLYGTTDFGGTGCGNTGYPSYATGCGTLFKYNLSTGYTFLYSFLAGTDGAMPYSGVVIGNDGNLYGATNAGGTNSDGTLFIYNVLSNTESVLYSFSGADGVGPNPLLQGLDGYLYGTAVLGGANGNYGVIFRY